MGSVIEGVVYGSTDAIVALTVHGPEGQAEHVDFKVDTGLTVPSHCIPPSSRLWACRAAAPGTLSWRTAA